MSFSERDVAAYLDRIGHPGGPPTLATLTGLSRAHVESIPFENVDVVLGTHRGIELDVVVDKLVHHRRGGYCYEHAGLFAAVAEHLGFTVHRLVARVQPDRPGPKTHMTLAVETRDDDELHLVDVGFGAGMMVPMPLRDGVTVDQAGWKHRLMREGRYWTLMKGDQRLHRFDTEPTAPIDYQVFHHWTSTHPDSPFTGQLVVMRLGEGVSRRLVRDTLTTEHADGRVEEQKVTGDTVVDVLASLDVHLDADAAAALECRSDLF